MLAKPSTQETESNNDAFSWDLPDLPNEEDEDMKTSVDHNCKNSKPKKDAISYCDIHTIFNQVQFTYGKLFIDIRPESEFKQQKIFQFINLPCDVLSDPDSDEKIIQQLMNSKRTKFEQNTFKHFNVAELSEIIYVVSNQEIIQTKKDIQFCKYLQNMILDTYDTHMPIVALSSPFNDFGVKFPFLCCSQYSEDILKYPSQIINDELFLGNMTDATTKQVLIDLKITHVINMTPQFSCQKFDVDPELKTKYLQCPIYDSEEVQIQKYFERGIAFMEEAFRKNKNGKIECRALVHCQAGVSRSSTMVIAYLMKVKEMSFECAYKYTQQRREIIEPNDGFVKQLKLYEKNNFVVKDQNIKSDYGILGYFK